MLPTDTTSQSKNIHFFKISPSLPLPYRFLTPSLDFPYIFAQITVLKSDIFLRFCSFCHLRIFGYIKNFHYLCTDYYHKAHLLPYEAKESTHNRQWRHYLNGARP